MNKNENKNDNTDKNRNEKNKSITKAKTKKKMNIRTKTKAKLTEKDTKEVITAGNLSQNKKILFRASSNLTYIKLNLLRFCK